MPFWDKLFRKKTPKSEPIRDLQGIVYTFTMIDTNDWQESRRMIEQHPELLRPEVDAMIESIAKELDGVWTSRNIEDQRALLARCREVGVEKAFVEKEPLVDPMAGDFPPELLKGMIEAAGGDEILGRALLFESQHLLEALTGKPLRATQGREDKVTIPDEFDNLMGEARRLEAQRRRDPRVVEPLIQLYKQILERLRPDEYPDFRAAVLNSLGIVYYNQPIISRGDSLSRAIQCYQEVVRLLSPERTPLRYSQSMDNLGNAYRNLPTGDRVANTMQAITCYQEALRYRSPQDDPHGYAMILQNLGNAYLHVPLDQDANLARAFKCYWEALDYAKPDNMPREYAMIQHNLGNAYSNLSRPDRRANLDKALECYREALRFRTPLDVPHYYASTHQGMGNAYHQLSLLGENQAGHRIQAMKHYEEALRIWTPEAAPHFYAKIQLSLAGVHAELAKIGDEKNLMKVIGYCQEALRFWTPTIAPRECCQTNQNLGNLLFSARRWNEAAEAYRNALEAGEILYQVAATPASRQSELVEIRNLPARLAFALAHNDQHIALVEGVETLERGRARALTEALALDDAALEKVTPEDQSAFEEARSRVRELQNESRLIEDMSGRRDFLTISNKLSIQYAELRRIIERIRTYVPEFFPETSFPQIQAVAQHLPLVYLAITDAGGMALIVHAGGIQCVWIDLTENELDTLLVKLEDEKIVGGYLPGQLGISNLSEALDNVLPRIGEKLIQPVVTALDNIIPRPESDREHRAVALIPIGRLALLPLHAATYQARNFLDDFVVSYMPSAGALAHSYELVSSFGHKSFSLFAIGNPLPSHKPLAFAQAEVEEITPLFKNVRATTLYEKQVTLKAVKSGLHGATHLHFSCHGKFNADNPLESSMLLGNSEQLTARDLISHQGLRHARLAVLSACQTAITDFNHLPDEAIGLPAGFLQAGVPGVVGTLWPVNDLSTALMMIKFYNYHLRDELAPAKALRKAQLWLRDVTNAELSELFDFYRQTAADRPTLRMAYETAHAKFREHTLRAPDQRPFAHPYHWAPFVFYGA